MYFWFPLLAGLSELTFDPRPDIRYSALEVSASTPDDLLLHQTFDLLSTHDQQHCCHLTVGVPKTLPMRCKCCELNQDWMADAGAL